MMVKKKVLVKQSASREVAGYASRVPGNATDELNSALPSLSSPRAAEYGSTKRKG